MKFVTLDTNALIWGIKKECTPGQEDMLRRADLLLDHLSDEKVRLVLPAISFAELMAPLNEQERIEFARKVEEKFVIVPFDTRAAHFAPVLWQAHRSLAPSERIKSRRVLKADVLIIASAYAAGVRSFYSNDKGFRRLAKCLRGGIASDLPTHSEFLPFKPHDLEEGARETPAD